MKKLLWVFPILFLIDNVLGLNGYQFAIFGVGIRIVLFALSVISLCLHCLYTAKEEHIALWKGKPGQKRLLDYCRPLDGFVLGFLVLNFLWATLVPLLKKGSLSYAINDFNTLCVLVLYFPCAFLIRTRQLTFRGISKWLFPLLLLLALWHSVMYVGEVLAPGFYVGYYDFIDTISFGTAVRTEVVIGYGITRIIQVTSVLLIPAFLMTLEETAAKVRPIILAAMALVMFAILITYTKSIWFGVLAGLAVALLGILIFAANALVRKRVAVFTLAIVVCFVVFNFGFLNNTIITRTLNSARPDRIASLESQITDLQQQLSQMEKEDTSTETAPTGQTSTPLTKEEIASQLQELESKRQDASGTAASNEMRSVQNTALLRKWSQSKLLGHGYGAYAEDCIRNETPYLYESLIPAMFMKLGIAGLLGWGVFVLAMVVFAVKYMWKTPVRFWCWIGTALAYAMAVQTNPFLFTFAGISLMLYLLLILADAQEDGKNK